MPYQANEQKKKVINYICEQGLTLPSFFKKILSLCDAGYHAGVGDLPAGAVRSGHSSLQHSQEFLLFAGAAQEAGQQRRGLFQGE